MKNLLIGLIRHSLLLDNSSSLWEYPSKNPNIVTTADKSVKLFTKAPLVAALYLFDSFSHFKVSVVKKVIQKLIKIQTNKSNSF